MLRLIGVNDTWQAHLAIELKLRCQTVKVRDNEILRFQISDRQRILSVVHHPDRVTLMRKDLFERSRQVIMVINDKDFSVHRARGGKAT